MEAHQDKEVTCSSDKGPRGAYLILLLTEMSNVGKVWKSVERRNQSLESAEEFKRLLSTSGTLVMETRTGVELLHLHVKRKKGKMPMHAQPTSRCHYSRCEVVT